jgi:hypothetical protein
MRMRERHADLRAVPLRVPCRAAGQSEKRMLQLGLRLDLFRAPYRRRTKRQFQTLPKKMLAVLSDLSDFAKVCVMRYELDKLHTVLRRQWIAFPVFSISLHHILIFHAYLNFFSFLNCFRIDEEERHV